MRWPWATSGAIPARCLEASSDRGRRRCSRSRVRGIPRPGGQRRPLKAGASSGSLLEGCIELRVVHNVDNRPTGAPCLHHGCFSGREPLPYFDHLARLLSRNEDGSAAVRDQQIAGPHLHPGHLDRRVEGLLDDPSARRDRDDGLAEDGKPDLTAAVDVAAGAVDNHAAHATGERRVREDVAPAGHVRSTSVVDDDDVAWLRGLDGGRCQVDARFGDPGRNDLDGYRAADDPRTWPERTDANRCPAQLEEVEGVGHGTGVQALEPLDERGYGPPSGNRRRFVFSILAVLPVAGSVQLTLRTGFTESAQPFFHAASASGDALYACAGRARL